MTCFSILNYKRHNIYTSVISCTYFSHLLPERAEVRRKSKMWFWRRLESAFQGGILTATEMSTLSKNPSILLYQYCTGAEQEDGSFNKLLSKFGLNCENEQKNSKHKEQKHNCRWGWQWEAACWCVIVYFNTHILCSCCAAGELGRR